MKMYDMLWYKTCVHRDRVGMLSLTGPAQFLRCIMHCHSYLESVTDEPDRKSKNAWYYLIKSLYSQRNIKMVRLTRFTRFLQSIKPFDSYFTPVL
jgi:hypothetical protein